VARPTQEQVEAEIALLGGLSLEALRERWHALYGNPAPRSLRRDFLIRAVAYQLRESLRRSLGGNQTQAARSRPRHGRAGSIRPSSDLA
jgi:hypothetical protein